MTAFQRYLAEEIAMDHAEGLLSRREALRRLSLLGFGLPAATALLAACGAFDSSDGDGQAAPSSPAQQQQQQQQQQPSAKPAGPSPLPTEAVTFRGPQGRTLRGAWANAQNPRGAVLVVHENKGLTPHIKSVAGRFAASGYSALAIDLLSEEGGTDSLGGEAQVTAALSKIPQQRFAADMKAGVSEIARRVPDKKIGAVGFCFGGGMVWLLVASKEPRLAAAAPFYGPLPDNASFAGSRAAVLGIYASEDQRVNASRGTATAALRRAGLRHQIVTFPGAGHAFFNDTGQRYNPTAASQAYQRVTNWFGRYLA